MSNNNIIFFSFLCVLLLLLVFFLLPLTLLNRQSLLRELFQFRLLYPYNYSSDYYSLERRSQKNVENKFWCSESSSGAKQQAEDI